MHFDSKGFVNATFLAMLTMLFYNVVSQPEIGEIKPQLYDPVKSIP